MTPPRNMVSMNILLQKSLRQVRGKRLKDPTGREPTEFFAPINEIICRRHCLETMLACFIFYYIAPL